MSVHVVHSKSLFANRLMQISDARAQINFKLLKQFFRLGFSSNCVLWWLGTGGRLVRVQS